MRVQFAAAVFACSSAALAGDWEGPPINYSKAVADNPVSRLQARLDSGAARLEHDGKSGGRLKALLRELGVPASSQTLVFSKTSFQLARIEPRTPRAIYFGDDAYVGWCRDGDVLEVSVADAQLGTVFYTLSQDPDAPARFQRQTDNCLICHGSSRTRGVPGHIVRSLYVDPEGYPMLAGGSRTVDHRTPFDQRWGGWYVTGTHGSQKHLGNLIVRSRHARPDAADNADGQNLTRLDERFPLSPYLTRHSDIVALMVMEHQTAGHNLIAAATLETRLALLQESEINRALGEPADKRREGTVSRIRSAGEPLVRYLLFSEEAALTAPVKGTSGFAEEWSARGPRDARGRSLRDLDLRTRLLRHPCSPLVYTEAFDGMPAPVRDFVLRRIDEVLSGRDRSKEFAHLSDDDRRAVREILRETKKGYPPGSP
jgi:hypothetical protein